jgi:hypothetical protein
VKREREKREESVGGGWRGGGGRRPACRVFSRLLCITMSALRPVFFLTPAPAHFSTRPQPRAEACDETDVVSAACAHLLASTTAPLTKIWHFGGPAGAFHGLILRAGGHPQSPNAMRTNGGRVRSSGEAVRTTFAAKLTSAEFGRYTARAHTSAAYFFCHSTARPMRTSDTSSAPTAEQTIHRNLVRRHSNTFFPAPHPLSASSAHAHASFLRTAARAYPAPSPHYMPKKAADRWATRWRAASLFARASSSSFDNGFAAAPRPPPRPPGGAFCVAAPRPAPVPRPEPGKPPVGAEKPPMPARGCAFFSMTLRWTPKPAAFDDGPGPGVCGDVACARVRVVRRMAGCAVVRRGHKTRKNRPPNGLTCTATAAACRPAFRVGRVFEARAVRDGGRRRPGGRVAAVIHAVVPACFRCRVEREKKVGCWGGGSALLGAHGARHVRTHTEALRRRRAEKGGRPGRGCDVLCPPKKERGRPRLCSLPRRGGRARPLSPPLPARASLSTPLLPHLL